jgi:hypothetical protein
VNDSQTMGAMSESIELVSNLTTRCVVQESLYLRRPSAIEELRKALINLYTTVLTYMSKALRYYEQPTISMSPTGSHVMLILGPEMAITRAFLHVISTAELFKQLWLTSEQKERSRALRRLRNRV